MNKMTKMFQHIKRYNVILKTLIEGKGGGEENRGQHLEMGRNQLG